MMAPLPTPNTPSERPELPRVRLDVRAGSGRPVSYEVGSEEFLIGGASGCDLRLPATSLPPVICQLTRKSDAVRVRRLTPALAVLLNGNPLPANTPVLLNGDDKLTLAGIEICISISGNSSSAKYLSPQFVPEPGIAQTQTASIAASGAPSIPAADPHGIRDRRMDLHQLDEQRRWLEAEERQRRDDWSRRDAELIQRARELDRQTEELEADRVLWYRRRQEIEAELQHQHAQFSSGEQRSTNLDEREEELYNLREELSTLRENLLKEHQDRRTELAHQNETLRLANVQLQHDRDIAASDLDQRHRELQAELEKHRANLDREASQRRELLEEEFRQQRVAFDAELAARAAQLEVESQTRFREQVEEIERLRISAREIVARAEVEASSILVRAEQDATTRRAKVQAELAESEAKLGMLQEQETRLAAGFRELSRERELLEVDRGTLAAAQATLDAERHAKSERLRTWEHELEEREAAQFQQLESLQAERGTFEENQQQFQDDLVRLERRTAAVEDQEQQLAVRSREIDVRLEQLKRDSAEWEETVLLITMEQERSRAEAERLARQRAELDNQSATLAERAGQLESQQAVLVVQRAKLDRTRQEAEREAAELATARTREEGALAELRDRIREAEELRAELTHVQENTAQERRRLEERDSLLEASLSEIQIQQEKLTTEAARLQEREVELDTRLAEFADQAGTLKGRVTQALDLQSRLEADRVAIREREAALAEAELARQNLQEQLRRRAEELSTRAKSLDEIARHLAQDRLQLDQARTAIVSDREAAVAQVAERRQEVEQRASEAEKQITDYSEKEQALSRQVARLKDVGAAVAAERKSLAEARNRWESERNAAVEADSQAREALIAFRAQAATEIQSLREQAPELEVQARASLERLSTARDMLRGHLTELHDFSRLSREDLAAIRAQVRQEAERLREQEETLNRAKAEHRLSVSAFRQQLIEWQGQVAEMKSTLSMSESQLDARQAAVDEAARQVDATTHHLAEQAEQLRRERHTVSARRTEVERHLSEMREWYRKKLRELAAGKAVSDADMPPLKLHEPGNHVETAAAEPPRSHGEPEFDDLNPGDRQLGELLQSHGLVDGETLGVLWAEAGRQRRTLRQVLLASGVITLYQLALIEAGNLDALMLGRFRVFDRLRVTPREAMYRVFDPSLENEAAGRNPMGVYLLRHLAEAELQDAVHPDEFRQRFAAVRDTAHPNLAQVLEVLEIQGRPAVLQEWLTGLFSADWPPFAANPGCWVRLALMAAGAIDAAHRNGLVHGQLTSDSFVLTPDGVLKVIGFGEPPWLATAATAAAETSPAADLRAFGLVLFGWSQLASKRKGSAKPKPFPEQLLTVIRRLEAEPEPPMADTLAAERQYQSTADLVADLNVAAHELPVGDDAWAKLLIYVAENAPEAMLGLKQSA